MIDIELIHKKVYFCHMLERDYQRVDRTLIIGRFLTSDERESALGQWIMRFIGMGEWDDTVEPIIKNILNLPLCPQQWRYMYDIPLEEKMQDTEYVEYYNYMMDFEQSLWDLFGNKVSTWRELSHPRTEPYSFS